MKIISKRSTSLAWLLLLTVFASLPVFAQVNLGSIQGQVQDAQHASVPGAQLSLKNENTGVVATSRSTASGSYSFLSIAPGNYTLSTVASGFSTAVQQHIVVGTGASVTNEVTLQPGQVQETVSVNSTASSVSTETSDISTVITPEEIKDLPISLNADMRNPLNFVVLTPGVAGSAPGASPAASGRR